MSEPQEIHVHLAFRAATDEAISEELLTEAVDHVVEAANGAAVDVSVRIERLSERPQPA